MAHTFSKQLTPGTPENVTDVMTNFNEAAADWELAFSTYKEIKDRAAVVPGSTAAATLVLPSGGAAQGITPPATAILNPAADASFYVDLADYTAGTRTTKYRVRAQLFTNANAPTITYTVGLYPVSTWSVFSNSGVTNFPTVNALGTVTSGSTVAFASPGASNGGAQGNSGDFTAPAAGHYVFGVVLSGTSDVGATVLVRAELQTRQV